MSDLRSEFCVRKFGLSNKHPSLFVAAQCFKAPVYLIWSGFGALFFFSMLMLDIYYSRDVGAEYLVFLTNVSYMFQTATLLIDFTITVHVYLNRPDIKEGNTKEMTWYLKVQWLMFNATNTISILLTALYYTLLSPDFTHGSINKHLLNSVHSILNIFICAKPVQILHFYHPMLYAIVYLVFTIIYHLAGADPIYEPLDWSNPGMTSLKAILTICLACPLVHIFLFFTLFTVRVYLSQRCCQSKVEPEPEVYTRPTCDADNHGISQPNYNYPTDSKY